MPKDSVELTATFLQIRSIPMVAQVQEHLGTADTGLAGLADDRSTAIHAPIVSLSLLGTMPRSRNDSTSGLDLIKGVWIKGISF